MPEGSQHPGREAKPQHSLFDQIGSEPARCFALGSSTVAKYPDKRIFLRERARVIRRYDEPKKRS